MINSLKIIIEYAALIHSYLSPALKTTLKAGAHRPAPKELYETAIFPAYYYDLKKSNDVQFNTSGDLPNIYVVRGLDVFSVSEKSSNAM